MGVVITLRNSLDTSFFKEFMLGMLAAKKADAMLISSGYFQEYTSYSICNEKDKSGKVCLLDYVDDFNSISIVGHDGPKTSYWENDFINFINAVKGKCKSVVTGYNCKEHNWHAKVFILLNNNTPIAGIIGSSNMTRRAYGSLNTPSTNPKLNTFNQEADVIIFSDELQTEVNKVAAEMSAIAPGFVLVTEYNPENNGDLDESELLKGHYDRIMGEALDENKFETI